MGTEETDRPDERMGRLCIALQAFAEASTDPPRLLETIAQQVIRVIAEGCAVCVTTEGSSSLRVESIHHRDAAVASASKALLGSVVEIDAITTFFRDTGARSILHCPMHVRDKTLGAIVACRNAPAAAPFDPESAATARMLADGAALALSNARLFEASRRELEERRRTEEEMKRFVALVQHSSDVVAMASLSGEVLFVNEAGRTLLGVEPDDEITLEMFHTEEGMKRAAIIQAKGRWEGEGVLRHFRTGALIPTQVSSFLLRDAEGKPMGYATVQRDLRPVRALEQHMRQMQKMDAIGRLAAGVAHDFNNMLSIILSYGSLVLGDLPEDSAVRPELDEMLGAARRAGQLTHQLLAFSRQQVLEPREISLNEVVTGIERMARRLLREDVQLSTSLAEDAGLVRVDVGQIEQVILNLAVNARDAMPSGGSLEIATGHTQVEEDSTPDPSLPPGRYVTLRVKDTGHGMDDATLARIFEPFFTTKAPGAGTGLGLATVFGVVRQSGGHISVASQPGKGTTFTIYLPRLGDHERTAEREQPPPPAAPRPDGREKILLVEDEARVRKLVEAVLRRGGYEVIEASTVSAALEICARDERIDLLLTDVVMPKMSGPQLAARFTASRPEAKVLYVSGYMDVEVVGLELEFLRKPFTPEALLRRVRDVLDGKPSITSAPVPGRSPRPGTAA
jgi:two-component system, cell cycle sensor histidine kinase and response regulator CckA